MILLVYHFFNDYLGIQLPAVFIYSSSRMVFAALTTLLFAIFLGPRFIARLYGLKTGQLRVENCPVLVALHQNKKETPTMGGILILSSMILALLLWMDWKSSFTLIMFLSTISLGFIGGCDDYLKLKYKNTKGLSAKRKLFFQVLLAACIAAYLFFPEITDGMNIGKWFSPPIAKEQLPQIHKDFQGTIQTLTTQEYASHYYLPFVKTPILILKKGALLFGVLITIFTITGSSNAVNLTDGLDGLAAGCLVMVALVLSLFAFLSNNIEIAKYLNILYIEGSAEIGIYLCALAGACLGFLWYNGHPAQVFMGDVGSLSLGGIIGISAVLLRRELLLAIIGGIFVAETLSVILQVSSYKLRHKKRIFLCTPLHHHFEYKGWPETKVVMRFWIIALILAVIGIASIKLQ